MCKLIWLQLSVTIRLQMIFLVNSERAASLVACTYFQDFVRNPLVFRSVAIIIVKSKYFNHPSQRTLTIKLLKAEQLQKCKNKCHALLQFIKQTRQPHFARSIIYDILIGWWVNGRFRRADKTLLAKPAVIRPLSLGMAADFLSSEPPLWPSAVSYTHLTLPTIVGV